MADFTELLARAKKSLSSAEFTIDYISGLGEHITITRAAVTDHQVSIRFNPRNVRPWKLQMYGGPHLLPRGRARYFRTFEAAVIVAAEKLNELAGATEHTPADPTIIEPRHYFIGRSTISEKLYTLESARAEAISKCAIEWSRVMGVPGDKLWTKTMPQALFDILTSFSEDTSVPAASAYLKYIKEQRKKGASK